MGNNKGMWERFFNAQSDWDWTWGPFLLPLRPARSEPMPVWVWVRLFLALSVGGLMLIGIGALACVLGPRLAAQQHWRVPPGLAETGATLAAMASDPSLRWTAAGLLLCLPLLFFGFCLPFHVAWNRRAARLSQEAACQKAAGAGNAAETKDAGEDAGIWPPAPNPRRPV